MKEKTAVGLNAWPGRVWGWVSRGAPVVLMVVILMALCYHRSQNHLWKCTQLHLEQAQSFLNGRLDLEKPDRDAITRGSRFYSPYSTTPVLMYLPFVALWGTREAIPYAVLLMLTLLNLSSVRLLCSYVKLEGYYHWFLVALFFGTGYWACLAFSYAAPYNNAVIVVTFLLSALSEAGTRCRPWVVGLYWSIAVTTRAPAVFSIFPILWMMWHRHRGTRAWRAWVVFSVAAIPAFAFYVTFNYLRFGNALETGYGYYNPAGVMSFRFAPVNLYYMLLKGFDLVTSPKSLYFRPFEMMLDLNGTSLLSASPFVLLALFAPWQQKRVKVAWLGLVLSALTVASFYTWGPAQFNFYRYALDFFPVVFLLMALGLRNHPNGPLHSLWKGFVCYAVFLNYLTALSLTSLLNRFLSFLLE